MTTVLASSVTTENAAGGGGLVVVIILIMVGMLATSWNRVPTVMLFENDREQEMPQAFPDGVIKKIIERLDGGELVVADQLKLPSYRARLSMIPGIGIANANRVDVVLGVSGSVTTTEDGVMLFAEIIPMSSEMFGAILARRNR